MEIYILASHKFVYEYTNSGSALVSHMPDYFGA
ncbi:unnamed protein product [Acanthoscelides obtectus]|uniref:Uncharacterized protein n=1 Tax=Acanthoscelides obtectus TaxID=200917 RepID=A0A9P0Q627_ACAOB|nr:unnamed protein product [Acanthoscelides obtectus]CAK1627304.1 hypothetical protein AOBTE_LOCUS4500 [Acanthoscelides obtectus]